MKETVDALRRLARGDLETVFEAKGAADLLADTIRFVHVVESHLQ